MYMLDTNICIYIMKRQPANVLERFQQAPVGSVCMSLITYGELHYGAMRSNSAGKALDTLVEFSRYIPVMPIENDVAEQYGDIRADLAAKGTHIGNNDLWIAAHARSLGHILVSNNTKEFERVQNLKLENWR